MQKKSIQDQLRKLVRQTTDLFLSEDTQEQKLSKKKHHRRPKKNTRGNNERS